MIIRHVFRQPRGSDIGQPVEDRLARQFIEGTPTLWRVIDMAVSFQVRLGDLLGMKLQQQIGPADVCSGITAACVGSIDLDGL